MGVFKDLRYVLRNAFLRHILILIAAMLMLGPVLGRFMIAPLYEDLLVRNTEAEAVRVSGYLQTHMNLPNVGFTRESLPADLDSHATDAQRHLQLAKLKIFSPEGVVIYSTDPGDIGRHNEHAYFHEHVARGEVFTKVVTRDRLSMEGRSYGADVVETYVPLRTTAGAFAGAFETYYDITERVDAVHWLADLITLATVVAGSVLLGMVLVLMARAGRAVAERERMERMLGELSHRHQMILDTAGEGIFVVDTAGRLTFINAAGAGMLGWAPEEIMGEPHHEKVHHSKADGSRNPVEDCPVNAAFSGEGLQHSDGETFWRKDGTGLPVELTAAPLMEEGQVIGAVGVFRDISQRLAAENALKTANVKLEDLARTDALTGVPNRRAFDEFLASAWNRHTRSGEPLALLMVDIDQFKAYNDLYGHQAGDACLRTVAEALWGEPHRATDQVARYGGEEFAMLLTDTGEEGAAEVAERTRQAVADLAIDHEGSGVERVVTISIGVAVRVPARGQSPERFVEAADAALYAAKDQGRNRVVVAD